MRKRRISAGSRSRWTTEVSRSPGKRSRMMSFPARPSGKSVAAPPGRPGSHLRHPRLDLGGERQRDRQIGLEAVPGSCGRPARSVSRATGSIGRACGIDIREDRPGLSGSAGEAEGCRSRRSGCRSRRPRGSTGRARCGGARHADRRPEGRRNADDDPRRPRGAAAGPGAACRAAARPRGAGAIRRYGPGRSRSSRRSGWRRARPTARRSRRSGPG